MMMMTTTAAMAMMMMIRMMMMMIGSPFGNIRYNLIIGRGMDSSCIVCILSSSHYIPSYDDDDIVIDVQPAYINLCIYLRRKRTRKSSTTKYSKGYSLVVLLVSKIWSF